VLNVRRAITVDADGKRIEGVTKNRYSRRSIRLTPAMREPLDEQRRIAAGFNCEYLFCTPNGHPVHRSNLRRNVWIPTLKRAGLIFREMKQTRHTFATLALSLGENPLWIAKVMGHRDTEMIIRVYSKYVEDVRGTRDGSIMNAIYLEGTGKQE